MADKTLGINTSMDVSDIRDGLTEIISDFKELPDMFSIDMNLTGDAIDQVKDLKENLEDLNSENATPDADLGGNAQEDVNNLESDLTDLESRNVAVDAEVTGDATKEMSDLETESNELDNKQVDIEVDASGDASENLQEDSESADSVTDALVGAASAATAYKFGMDGLSYQSYIGQAVAFTSATNDQRAAMEEAVRSNSSARYKVDDLAEAMDWLGKQTGDANEATSLFGTEMSYVKDNGADLQNSVTKLTNLYKEYGLNTTEAADATNTLNGEILKSGYTGDEFLNLTSKASLELKNMGFSLQDTGAIVSAFGQSGVNASDAMRAMRGGFATFVQDFSTSNSNLGDYESKIQSLGVATRDANGNLRSQKDVLSDLLVAFSKMPDGPEKTELAMELFGTSAGKVIGNLNTNYQSVEDSANSSSQAQVDAAKQVRQQTQDPYQWLINQLQLIASYLGITLSQLIATAGTVAGLAIFKFRHQIVDGLKSLPSDIADVLKNVKIADAIEKEVRPDIINKAFKEDTVKAEQVLEGARNPIKTKVSNIVSDIKNKFGELRDIKLGDIDVSTPKLEISSFVDNAKAKLNELKDSNVWSKIFSDEKGTVTTSTFKINSFVDDAKVKVGELDNYDVYDRIFKDTGEGDTALSKISGLVDNIKLKVADLDGSNVYNKVFGSGTPESTTTEEPVTPKVGETTGSDTISNIQEGASRGVSKFTETGGSIIDKIVEGAKKVTLPSAGEIVDGLFNGLKTSISLGSARATGMSLATTFFDFLKPAATLGGSDMFAFMGMDLPGNPLWNLENNQPLIDWDPINQMKADLANAGNKNVKGSLADQLNLPGWIKGQEPEINSALNGLEDSIKSHLPKMPNILGDLGNIKLPSLSSLESGIGSELNGLKSYITSHIPKIPNILGDLSKIKLPSLSSIESGIGSEFNSLKSYVTSHLPKVPNINWNTLGNGLGGVVTKAENTYNGLKSYVLSHVPKIPIPTWNNVSQGLSGIVSTAESEYGGLKSYVISHIPKVPIPSWSNIRSGLPGAVKTAEDDLRGLESFVGGVPGKLYSLGNQIGERFAAGIRSAEGDVNSALQWLKDRLPASPPKTGPLAGIKAENMQSWASGIAHAGVSGFSEIESGISSTLGSAVNTAESELNKIKGTVTGFSGEMESTASHLWNIGESMISNLSNGITAGLPDLSSVFSEISNMFPHSPPKEGPLASIKAENMKAWAKNIALAGVEGLSHFTGYMDEMVQLPRLSNLSSPGLTKALTSSQNNQTVINLNVSDGAVVIQGNADENVVKNAGSILGSSFADKLSGQANNRGVSTINVIR